MKKILLLTAGFFLAALTQVRAQTDGQPVNKPVQGSLFIGPVAGFGNSWVGNMQGDAMFKSSGYAGINLIELNNRHWGWGGQLDLSSEGYAVNDLGSVQTIKPLYLRVPLRAYYFFGNRRDWIRPNLYLGPSFGVKLAEYYTVSNTYYESYMAHNSSYFRALDAGIDGGGGLDFRLARRTWLSLDLGFYEGLTDAVKDAADTYNPNHDMDVSVSLLFDLR